MAAVFKIGGNALNKPIGARAKSVIGTDETDTPQGKNKKLTGILYDRYYKIPKPKGSKLNPKWKPEYMKALQKGNNLENLLKEIWDLKEQKANNPLAAMAWRLEKTLSSQGASCAICGSYEDVQMHHVRALKDISKSTNAIHKHMVAIERRQIPVCR